MAAILRGFRRARARSRVLVAVGVVAIASMAAAGPASAVESSMPAAQSDVMSTGQAILVFVGIPVSIAAVIYLLVLAPSWTRTGRTDVGDGLMSDPFVLGGDGPADRAALASAEPALDATSRQTGGTSASW